MTQKYDIPINLTVFAKDEQEAEQIALLYLRTADKVISSAEIGDYELFKFVPSDLAQSCCC